MNLLGVKIPKFVFFILLSLLIYFFVVVFVYFLTPGYNHGYKFILSFSIYYFGDAYILIKAKFINKESLILLSIIVAPPILIEMPIHIMHFKETLISLPSSLAPILALICSIICAQFKNSLKPFFTVGCIVLAIWSGTKGYKVWMHYLDYGSVSDSRNYKIPAAIDGLNQSGTRIITDSFKNKIVLLDFWYSGCGACFQEFPILQDFYNKYKSKSNLVIYAVDKPIVQDSSGTAFKIMRNAGYNFPILVPDDHNLPEKFGIENYPTVLVIDKSGYVIYQGDLESAIKRVKTLCN